MNDSVSFSYQTDIDSTISEKFFSEKKDNSQLPQDQVRMLLQLLSTNDDFRQAYESNPANALIQMGVSPDIVMNLKTSCLSPKKLGNKELFPRAAKSANVEITQQFSGFFVPSVFFGRKEA